MKGAESRSERRAALFMAFLLPCTAHLEFKEAFSGCICAKIQMAADGCAGADMSSGTFVKEENFIIHGRYTRNVEKGGGGRVVCG